MILAGEMPDNKVNPDDLAPDLPEDATGVVPDDLPSYDQWSDSNFIPRISKKFEFRNLDFTIRFYMKNESRNRKNEVM